MTHTEHPGQVMAIATTAAYVERTARTACRCGDPLTEHIDGKPCVFGRGNPPGRYGRTVERWAATGL